MKIGMHLEKKITENGKTVEHYIVVRDAKQIYQNSYWLSQAQSKTLDQKLKEIQQGGIIKENVISQSALIILFSKRYGPTRLWIGLMNVVNLAFTNFSS